jgi:hypothetical protein
VSQFRRIPQGFPFDVSLKSRPSTFRLQADAAERGATLVLSLFWTILGTAVLYAWADPFAPWDRDDWLTRIAALSALAAFLVFIVFGWLWPAASEAMEKMDIEISDESVAAHISGLTGRQHWSEPLRSFEGVQIENWGTLAVGQNKIPVKAIVLKHRDDSKTLPLRIDGALKIRETSARRKADQLGLPFIDGEANASGDVMPEGAIVVNRFQGLKVKALYALFSGGGSLAAAWLVIEAIRSGDGTLYLLAGLSAALAAAMHLFASCYVTEMRRDAGAIVIDTASVIGRHTRIAPSEITAIGYREGRGTSQRFSIHAPWVKVAVSGARWPYIVDMQSEYVDEAALLALHNTAKK